jgi:hypothetical protein
MSTVLQPRRSARERIPAQSLAAEMEYRRLQVADQALLRRLAREPVQYDSASDSDEEELDDGECSSSDDEVENKENAPPATDWLPDTHDITLPPCTAVAAVVLPRTRTRTELGYFRCFITDTLIDIFVTNTIAYSQSRHATPPFETDAAEIWRFIAAHIRMGIVSLPNLHMYWQAEYRDSYVTQLFSRDRFLLLQRYFHIAPPTPAGERHTVVEKIAPLYRDCQTLFQSYFTPGREFAVDESMVRFKGRSSWKTVIKGKPTPIGYKLYTVASQGYLLGFRIYRGKGGYNTPHSAIHHTVVDLVQPWANCNRILFFDNLYTSPKLCDHLQQMGIRACGTCRRRRKDLPPGIGAAMDELDKGEYKAWQRGQLGCIAWHSAKPVLFLSTHHRVDHFVTVAQDNGQPAKDMPQVAVDYNNNKGHVDTIDQMRQYYAMQRRGVKTWPSLAWWLIDMCIINAYTLWSLDTKTASGQLHFREQLLHQIAALFPSPRTPVQPDVPARGRQPFLGHWPKHTNNRRECQHCSQGRRGRKRSYIECAVCGVHLCLDPCFGTYHDGLEIDNRQS